MAKYTLIIADDEEIARKALNLLIKKELPNIDVIALAENGSELVTFVQAYQPDLAIVDVNMPGLSGIDAIDLLASRGCKTRFIINTAYEEFEYVQKALSLKVDAYLLKPERRENTVATIRRLCAEIDRSRSAYQSQRQIWELFTNLQPVLESEILYSLFIGEASADSFRIYCEMHNYTFAAGTMVVLLPVLNGRGDFRGQDKKALRIALDEAFGGSCTYLATVTESSICLLIFAEEAARDRQCLWLKDVLRVALDRLNSRLSMSLRAGVGGIYPSFERMTESYREALLALNEQSLDGIAFHRSEEEPDEHHRIAQAARTLALAARSGNQQRIATEALHCRGLVQTSRSAAVELWSRIGQELTEQALTIPQIQTQLAETAACLAQNSISSDSMTVIQEGLIQVASLLSSAQPEPGEGYAERAIRYIEEHYAEDFSLEVVAEYLGISGGYLSRLISAEQNKTFVECLTETRIRAATSLALETRLPIREIAKRCGYSNTTYFCRVFKKYTGKTIGEMREEHRRKS